MKSRGYKHRLSSRRNSQPPSRAITKFAIISLPRFSRKDPHTGRPRKYEFGGWVTPVFKVMAKMKGLRGSAFDIFGYTEERKMERGLIERYEATVSRLIAELSPDNHALATEIACLPDKIRGYGFIKEDSVKTTLTEWDELMGRFDNSPAPAMAAE